MSFRAERLPSLGGARQGENLVGELGYRGPVPPADDGPHRSRFTVAALHSTLSVPAAAERSALGEAVSGPAIDRGRLVGTADR